MQMAATWGICALPDIDARRSGNATKIHTLDADGTASGLKERDGNIKLEVEELGTE